MDLFLDLRIPAHQQQLNMRIFVNEVRLRFIARREMLIPHFPRYRTCFQVFS
jgi:hypothetical protein